jgi:hypothetical protein
MRLSLYCEVCPTEHGNPSLRFRSIFFFSHFQVMAGHATKPFVVHAWLLRRSQLKYSKMIDNHIAGKKTQRTTSICCNLCATKETYQKLLWYTFYTTLLLRSANPFWIGVCQNLVFFTDSYCNSTLLFYFFNIFFIKTEYLLYWYHLNGFCIWDNNNYVYILYLCY